MPNIHTEKLALADNVDVQSVEDALNHWGISLSFTRHISGYDVYAKLLQGQKKDEAKKVDAAPPYLEIIFEHNPRQGEFSMIPLLELRQSIMRRITKSLQEKNSLPGK